MPFMTFLLVAVTFSIYTLSLHDALPIWPASPHRPTRARSAEACLRSAAGPSFQDPRRPRASCRRSEEHTSELQSLRHLVCRLLLEKNKKVVTDADFGLVDIINGRDKAVS